MFVVPKGSNKNREETVKAMSLRKQPLDFLLLLLTDTLSLVVHRLKGLHTDT